MIIWESILKKIYNEKEAALKKKSEEEEARIKQKYKELEQQKIEQQKELEQQTHLNGQTIPQLQQVNKDWEVRYQDLETLTNQQVREHKEQQKELLNQSGQKKHQ